MTYTFRIVFSGLCAFVPNVPLANEGKPTSAVVLFRALENGLTLPTPPPNIVLPHFPMIEFNRRNYREESSTRELNSRVLGLCILDYEDLRIGIAGSGGSSGKNMQVKNDHPNDPHNPVNDERHSLYFLPKMEVPVPGARVNPDLLGDFPDQSLLVGRVFLNMGTLSTYLLQEGTWIFGEIGDPDPGAQDESYFSETLALEITGLDKDIELSFNEFGESDCETLVLGPDPEDPTADVEILIVNREFPEPSPQENVQAPYQRLDFAVYYDLLASPTPAKGRLVPQRTRLPLLLRPGGCSPVAINS